MNIFTIKARLAAFYSGKQAVRIEAKAKHAEKNHDPTAKFAENLGQPFERR